MAGRHAGVQALERRPVRGAHRSGRPDRARVVRHRGRQDGASAWLHQEVPEGPKRRSGDRPQEIEIVSERKMTAARKNPHLGTRFEDFLAQDGALEAATLVATKRVLAWRIAELMKKQRVTKTMLAKRMKTSRAALDRLLDDRNTAVTLQTMGRAAAVLGQELTITLRSAA